MSSDLHIQTILGVLEDLGSIPAEFAAEEAELLKTVRLANAKLKSALERDCAQVDERLEADLAELVTAEDQARQDFEGACRNESKRIAEAHKNSRRTMLERVQHKEDISRSKIQEQIWVAQNAHKADLARAEGEHEQVQTALGELGERLQGLRSQALRALANLGRRTRALTEEAAGVDDASLDLDAAKALLEELDGHLQNAGKNLHELQAFALQAVFGRIRYKLTAFLLVVVHAIAYGVGRRYMPGQNATVCALGSLAGCLVLLTLLYLLWRSKAVPLGLPAIEHLMNARACWLRCERTADLKLERDRKDLIAKRDGVVSDLETKMHDEGVSIGQERQSGMADVDARNTRVQARSEQRLERKRERLEEDFVRRRDARKEDAEAEKVRLSEESAAVRAERETGENKQWQGLEERWQKRMGPVYGRIDAALRTGANLSKPWDDPSWEDWTPPNTFAASVPFGRLRVDVPRAAGSVPSDDRLALPGPASFDLPLALAFPDRGSVLLETWASGRDHAIDALNNVALRVLTSLPPGKANFILVDPVALGQSFAAFMHLTDYEDSLVGGRIWTEPRQIEQRLADLNEHMEKVIQMYLRNEYSTICEYNQSAGEVAEKYHFLLIADFPANFSEAAARRLLSVAASGAKCGVYCLLSWDRRLSLPSDFAPEELTRNCIHLSAKGDEVIFAGRPLRGVEIELEPPPPPERLTTILHRVGRESLDSSRVEVPFSVVMPKAEERWSASTTKELRVPVGRSGATKLQQLALGKGTLQHVLIAGKTGSGKSTLLHVLITNLALWHSPDEVEFYLIDFKKGVEFKAYATKAIPHARAVAIESDREFGLSVLQRVDRELKDRGELFRSLGVQDLTAYRKCPGQRPMPRTLLIIDEFQELFVDDDRIAQNASLLLDRIIRQGRAFGIHVLLGSQTLGGAYTLARATLGQMAVRIALQCSEADSFLILSDDNAAARLLSRPGEAIYNDAAGLEEGNSPFQVVWLPDEERDRCLDCVNEEAAERGYTSEEAVIVFEGNAPANVALNRQLCDLLERGVTDASRSARAWLGEPNAIKGPTAATFYRQSGSNLLMAGQRDEAALALMMTTAISIAAQQPPGTARFVVLDGSPPESPNQGVLGRLAQALPHDVDNVSYRNVPDAMARLAEELEKRQADPEVESGASIYVLIYGLQRFSKLRYEDDYGFSMGDDKPANPGQQFNSLITEGPAVGIHIITWCDTYNNVGRALNRRALSEFEMRVLFQMSAADSANLIDSPAANSLGLYGGIFHNEQEGTTEKFRPYAMPDSGWLEEVGKGLGARG